MRAVKAKKLRKQARELSKDMPELEYIWRTKGKGFYIQATVNEATFRGQYLKLKHNS